MEEGKNFNYDETEKKFHHGIDHDHVSDISIFRIIVNWEKFTTNGFNNQTAELLLTTMKAAIQKRIEIYIGIKK